MVGRKVARLKTESSHTFVLYSTAETMTLNKTHHQYSGLLAQPEKSAYLEKQVRIDSMNVMKSNP
jgi:hypothetical protein